MKHDNAFLYGGFSGATLESDYFDLGHGIVLRKTYAYLMAPYIVAFTPSDAEGNVPAPWKTAKDRSN